MNVNLLSKGEMGKMLVKDLADKLDLRLISGEEGLKNNVEGAYCCDLLSWVMAHGSKNDAWITVQIHPNIVAVASLLEMSCIIIPESIEVEPVTIDKSNQESIPILQSRDNAYLICSKLSRLI